MVRGAGNGRQQKWDQRGRPAGAGLRDYPAMMLVLSVLSVFKVNAIDNSLQHISEVNNVKQLRD
jgi:hypothetical protein